MPKTRHYYKIKETSSIRSLAVFHKKKQGGALTDLGCIKSCGVLQQLFKHQKLQVPRIPVHWQGSWQINYDNNYFILCCDITSMDQGEPGLDYDDPNLNPLVCDICNKSFDSLDKLGEHQKKEHDM